GSIGHRHAGISRRTGQNTTEVGVAEPEVDTTDLVEIENSSESLAVGEPIDPVERASIVHKHAERTNSHAGPLPVGVAEKRGVDIGVGYSRVEQIGDRILRGKLGSRRHRHRRIEYL